jgi:hypothetical protein
VLPADVTTFSGTDLNHSLAFQLVVGFGNGIPVHSKLFCEGTNRGKGLADPESAGSGRGFYLVNNLEVNRLPGTVVEVEEHLTVIGQYDSWIMLTTETLKRSRLRWLRDAPYITAARREGAWKG